MGRLYVYLNNDRDKDEQQLVHQFLTSVFAKEGWEVVMQNRQRPAASGPEDDPLQEAR